MARPLLEPVLVEKARRAQAELGLCDACLGRRFAKVETGLTNAERGRLVREAAGAPGVAPASCHVCGGLMGDLDVLADVAVEALAPYEHADFLVGTRVDPEVERREAEANALLGTAETAERIQAELNREIGKRVVARTGKAVELKAPQLAVVVDTRFLDAELQFGGLYVFGRYRKLARDVPQTKWPCRRCDGRGCVRCNLTGKQYERSVEELVAAPFLAATGATQESFHGAGREDIDARALGAGRPFVLELKDPRVRSIGLAPMPDLVRQGSGGRVEVSDLRFTTKAEVAHVKEHRGDKTYLARVAFAAEVPAETLLNGAASLRGRAIAQRTPDRVAHRRADLVRERRVHDIVVEERWPTGCVLRIKGDAGLYIKELVSGDEGRTEPSLAGLLGVPAKVEELDIVDVEYDAPGAAPGARGPAP